MSNPTPENQKPTEAKYRGQPYAMTDKGLMWWRPRDGYHEPVLLTNFNARMLAQFLVDDGQETARAVRIEATMGNGKAQRAFQLTIPVKEFALMNWPIEHLDARAMVYGANKPKTLEAIQFLSPKLEEHYMYQHIGWREIKGQQVYLHAGGGIAAKGPVKLETQLNPALRNYQLPEPRRRPEIARAVRASMRMLDLAPDRVTFPLFAAVWRATLGQVSFSVHLSGLTGTGKSQLAALAQQHYGPKMNGDHLPASWSSTANALEALAFECKDGLLVVDDFVPLGNMSDIQRLNRDADRLLRAQGNQAGKIRMNADLSLRPSKPPRGLILSTGEDVPGGQSLRARLIVVELAPKELDFAKLTECQQQAAAGEYSLALAGFLRWLAPRISNAEKSLQRAVTEYRKAAEQIGNHKRTPDNIANLMQGFHFWLSYATHVKAIQPKQRAELWARACKAFDELIGAQSSQQSTTDPTRQFISLIGSAFAAGRGHLAATSGGAPDFKPAAFGWTRENGDKGKWIAQGPKIGWVKDAENVYLDPSNAFAAAQSLAKESGQTIPWTLSTLQRRLKQAGVLVSTDEATERVAVRRMIEGAQRAVLHFSAEALYPRENPANPAKRKIDAGEVFSQTALEVDFDPAKPANPASTLQAQVPPKQQPATPLQGLQGFPKGRRPGKLKLVSGRKKAVQGSKKPTLQNAGSAGSKTEILSAADRRAARLRNL